MSGEILIVDENPGVQRALKRFLSQHGYEEALKNGASAYVTKPFDSAEILRYIHQLQNI